jgi:hypothetical protein
MHHCVSSGGPGPNLGKRDVNCGSVRLPHLRQYNTWGEFFMAPTRSCVRIVRRTGKTWSDVLSKSKPLPKLEVLAGRINRSRCVGTIYYFRPLANVTLS